MMDTGVKTKLMVSESTPTQTEPSTKVTGSTISSMDRAKKNGLMVLSTRETTNSERKTVSVDSYGLTDLYTKETS